MMRRGVLLTSTCAAAATLAAGAIAYAATESQARLERLNVRETVLSAEQGRNLNRMARLLTALAQFRRDPPPALLVSPGDATDAVRAALSATVDAALGAPLPIAWCRHGAGPPVCWCRKPLPGLGVALAQQLDLDLAASWHVGTGAADRGFAERLGLRYVEVSAWLAIDPPPPR